MSQAAPRRVLVAYDGSDGAAVALEHLCRNRAGLPDAVEARVLTIADMLMPAPESKGAEAAVPVQELAEASRKAAQEAVDKARGVAERAANKLQRARPGWRIEPHAHAGSSAHEILVHAADWQTDLIVIGWRGRKRLARTLLGSVAQQVLNEARCAVRVVRGRLGKAGDSASLILGVDGSVASDAAVEAVAGRSWPSGSVVWVVSVLQLGQAWLLPSVESPYWVTMQREHAGWMTAQAERAAARLRQAGLTAHVLVKSGDPKEVLIREARRRSADALVIGAAGMRGLARLLMGSVATAVTLRADCTVEVVRPRQAVQPLSAKQIQESITVF